VRTLQRNYRQPETQGYAQTAPSSGSAPDGGTGYLQAGQYGHVAYVTHVFRDGSVTVGLYNLNSNRSFSRMHVKANRYLYLAG
jgi:surface antigen